MIREKRCMYLWHGEILCNSLSDCNNPLYSGVWKAENCCGESLQHSAKLVFGTAATHLNHCFLQVLFLYALTMGILISDWYPRVLLQYNNC